MSNHNCDFTKDEWLGISNLTVILLNTACKTINMIFLNMDETICQTVNFFLNRLYNMSNHKHDFPEHEWNGMSNINYDLADGNVPHSI